METKHTQGPWLYRPQRYDDWGIVRAADKNEYGYHPVICQANYAATDSELFTHRANRTDPAEANARLIAAAPDLLNLAKCNLATMEEVRRSCIRWDKPHNELDTAIAETICQIAKATL